jgi:hypothetical protein
MPRKLIGKIRKELVVILDRAKIEPRRRVECVAAYCHISMPCHARRSPKGFSCRKLPLL